MDADRFDRLVASLTRPGTRRGALRSLTGAILGSAGLGALLGSEVAGKDTGKGKHKRRGKNGKVRKGSRVTRAQALPASCCASGDCAPGPSKYLAKCCYEDAGLAGAIFKQANLSNANFHGANVSNADFRQANLQNACLVDADLTGAKLTGANLTGAVFCRTKTGANTFNNSGCGKSSKCCPTCVPVDATGCNLGGACCGGAVCTGDGEGTCVCPQGLTNCNGKCVDLLRDLDNCTECGNVCPRPLANALVQCGRGIDENGEVGYGCTVLCARGFGNCSGDPLTGCETPLTDDPANCGSCGKICPSDTPICCGCLCFVDNTICSTCPPVSNAKLIRGR